MRHIKKIFRTSQVEGSDPYLKLQDHLMNFRATPHPTTGKSPAELLFGRPFKTNIPDIRRAAERPDIQEARRQDEKVKEATRLTVNKRRNIRPHSIKLGDQVLLKQKTYSKCSPIFDPNPYTVTQIWGTQIEGKRDGTTKVRDAQRWKKIRVMTKSNSSHRKSEPSGYLTNPDIGIPKNHTESTTLATTGEVNNSEPQEPVQGPENHPVTRSLQLQLRSNPHVIFSSTPANRPRRQTRRPDRY